MCTDGHICNSMDNLSNKIEDYAHAIQSYNSALMRQFQRLVPAFIDEQDYRSSDTTIVLHAETNNLEIINCLIVVLSFQGTLTVGKRVFTLPAGLTKWEGLGWKVQASDSRTLTQGTAGAMGLELMGINVGDTGLW